MVNFTIGCFGKLPIYPDFIRHGAANREVQALDQWFQEGIHFAKSKLGQVWADSFLRADPWDFLFNFDETGHFLLGVYTPSRDQGGRLYPFFLFLRVERKGFELPAYFAPLCFSGVMSDLREMASGGWNGMDMKGVVSRLEGMSATASERFQTIRERYSGYLEDQTTVEFWTGLFGDFRNPRKYLIGEGLTSLLRPLRQNPSGRFRLGLVFPICLTEEGEGYDIPFWFDMVCRFLGRDIRNPVFFWNRRPSGGSPCMLAFLSPPSPGNFLFLVRPDEDGDPWYYLAPENPQMIDKLLKNVCSEKICLLDNSALSPGSLLDAMQSGG